MKLTETPNRLINEKSPYLLQHAHNPVDWYPWSDEAFDKAKKEDKPIFLSIGYSTCHWCHVMERESFEDGEVAALLNENYVSVKVDREERPDIDTIYMSVCQAMTGHGGWPLTVIMTPEKKPFFAGTYFPKESKRGMPGLIDVLQQVTELWATERNKVLESGNQVTKALQDHVYTHLSGTVTEDTLDRAFECFERSFDPQYGGFGRAPKFPTPHNLSFLLRYWKLTGRGEALEMVEKTLDSMYRGGIYDHIGFGFARYSTDRLWLAPHFEKMLYDNALLAIAYLEAYQATGKEKYAKIARDIFTYVLRDMTSPEGAFYSAEDADSEGVEGKFYLWTPEEVKEVLGENDGEKFCREYDITHNGNLEKKNIPNLIKTGYIENQPEILEKLFRHREKRIHPFKDDKVLTAWNGLMIAALALGSRALDEPRYAEAAEKAAGFILKTLKRRDGRLLARFRDGDAAHPGYVDDYAFIIWGLIELHQATFVNDYLVQALELSSDLLRYFWDEEQGGLFQYGSDAENLISRPKELYDGALPSGNSVAALNLLRLARLTGNTSLDEKARDMLQAFGGTVSETPAGYSHFLMAAWFDLSPAIDVTITGNPKSGDTQEMIRTANRVFAPGMLLIVKETDSAEPTAQVCKDFACLRPVTGAGELADALRDKQ